jgi:hypothetical protein
MRALVLLFGATALAACANMQPRSYVVDGHTKSITPGDLQEILAVVHSELHSTSSIPPAPRIYRIHVRGATRVEVWYGDPKRDKWLNYILVGRFPGVKGWVDAGGGQQLRGYPRPNQPMKPTAPDRTTVSVFAADPARGLSLSR